MDLIDISLHLQWIKYAFNIVIQPQSICLLSSFSVLIDSLLSGVAPMSAAFADYFGKTSICYMGCSEEQSAFTVFAIVMSTRYLTRLPVRKYSIS